jgi:hypothetical protein
VTGHFGRTWPLIRGDRRLVIDSAHYRARIASIANAESMTSEQVGLV